MKKKSPYWHEFIRLSTENGLSSNTITCIEQDSKGFIWMGTEDGLSRYDGKSFVPFATYPAGKGARNCSIGQLFAGKNGRMYFRTSDHIGFIDYGSPEPTIWNTLHGQLEYSFLFTERGTEKLLLLKERIVYKLLISGKKISIEDSVRLPTPTHVSQKPIVAAKKNGELSIVEGNKVSLVDWTAHTLRSVQELPKEAPSIFTAIVDSKGYLWLGGWIQEGSINVIRMPTEGADAFRFQNPLDELEEGFEKRRLANEGINFLCETKSGDIWIGTRRDGAFCLRHNEPTKLLHFEYEPNDPRGLSGNRVTAVKEDETGGLWIGLESFGINFLPILHKPFSLLRHYPLKMNSLSNNYIRSIYRASTGDLWVCTQFGGLNRVSLLTEKVDRFNQSGNLINAWAITELSDGRLVAGFNGPRQGVYLISPKTDSLDSQLKKIADIERTYVIAKIEKGAGEVLIVGGDGLWRLEGLSKNKPVVLPFCENQSVKMGLINDLLIDREKRVWVAAEEGLFLYSLEGKFIQAWDALKDGANLQPLKNVCQILERQNGEIWVASKGSGIVVIDKGNSVSAESYLSAKQKSIELPSKRCYAVLEDEAGGLWVSYDGGLFSFKPESEAAVIATKQYKLNDGLQGHEFNRRAFFKDREERLYFGETNGLSHFLPSEIERDTVAFRVAIGGVKLFEAPIDFSKPRNLEFEHDENFISLTLSEFTYQPRSLVRYVYQVNGNPWRETNGNTISFLSLEPRKYNLQIKGIHAHGYESQNQELISFIIHPPIYKTAWAYGFYATMLFIAVIWVIRYRTERIRKENVRLERLVGERTKDLAEANSFKSRLMEIAAHDLRNPLQSIFGFAKLIGEAEELGETKRFATIIEKSSIQMVMLLEELLERSSARNDSVTLKAVNVEQMLKDIIERWKGAADVKLQKLSFETELSEKEVLTELDEGKMNQVLDNLISNAIKYTPKEGAIRVAISKTKGYFLIRVEDNGLGLSEEDKMGLFQKGKKLSAKPTNGEESHGIGLSIAKELIVRQGGKIWAESEGKGKGTSLVISLPCSEKISDV